MSSQPEALPLLGYATMLRRRWLLILIIVVGMVVPALAVSLAETPLYQATGQILLLRQQLDDSFNVSPGVLTDTQVGNEVALLTGADVAERANQLGATTIIDAVGAAGSNVVTITAKAPDPRSAVAALDAYIRAYSDYRIGVARKTLDDTAAQLQSTITGLQNKLDDAEARSGVSAARAAKDRITLEQQQASAQAKLGQIQVQQGLVTPGMTVVQRPSAAQSPVSPTPIRNSLLATVLGLVLGISFAILLESLRRSRGDTGGSGADGGDPITSLATAPLLTTPMADAPSRRSRRDRDRRRRTPVPAAAGAADSSLETTNGHHDVEAR